ncbi:hypothetical protein FQN57_000324 [Myotisia sp. PD_48]|nr:hypothetical protein FQN57_000324 [Myotisia sp. PD_48]
MRSGRAYQAPVFAGASRNRSLTGPNTDFNIPNYPYYSSSIVPMQSSAVYPPAQTSTTAANDSSINPSIPSLVPQHSPIAPQNQSLATAAGPKRKPEPPTLDEPGRLAQEEDKRRRNTAASARFRIKKKEREKNLERTVKDITTKNSNLEARVNQLEMENRWLKNLITEKNGSVLSDGDLSGMFHKYRESNEGTPQQQGSTSSSNGSESR